MSRTLRSVTSLACVFAVGLLAAGEARASTTWHVDAAAVAPGNGSAASPFTSIQAGIDAAAAGDHVLVAPGEYVENAVAPDMALHIESEAGPLATIWRAAGPGPALRSFAHSFSSTLEGFTFTQSDTGLEADAELTVTDCILIGNGIGVRSHGPVLEHCTITGNGMGVFEHEYGAVMSRSIVWGNATWDFYNQTFSAFSFAYDCVGLQKTLGLDSSTHVLVADPLLWNPAGGDVHLQPGSPCIGYSAGSDVGALPFDAGWGADFLDVGGGLAGAAGTPSLAASGLMLAGHPVTLALGGGLPGGAATLVVGSSQIGAPFKGGTLVPHPDLLLVLVLDGSGALAPSFAWPAGVPSGLAIWCQAWMPDAAGPAGWSASNGLKLTPP